MATTTERSALDPLDYLAIDALLDDEERAIRDTVREFVRANVLPYVADWFEAGTFPRELFGELGKLGLLGMHIEGYGLPGASSVAYGLTCMELEAGDAGVRSAVSVQGSLAMFPIWRFGSEEQKERWLPPMHTGEAIGCFGLTEPDAGSDPGSMRTHARRDGSDWILNGAKMWITNGTIADIAIVWARTDEGAIRGFIVEKGMAGFSAPEIHKKLSLRASVTSELVLQDVRVPDENVLEEVGDWFEKGIFPREIFQELARLGLLGMHLDGYGLPGASSVAYGLTCMELEAGDAGVRSAVSVQGSLAMYPVWRFGSEEQKERWLPPMHAGEVIGCFGLTEPDAGSDPGSMRTHARRDGTDWILNGAKMWITNGTIADMAIVWARTDEDAIHGFIVE